MMYLLYDLILTLAAFILVPFYLVQSLVRQSGRLGLRQRLGFYTKHQLATVQGRQVIWVHAVSVGETRAAIPLIRALKEAWPEAALVLSNTTQTGHSIGCGIREVDLCLYFPFDISWVVSRVFRKISPDLVVIVETELWPNFIRTANRRGVPIVLANGRISDRSFPRYYALRRLLGPILQQFSAFCMQSEKDAHRIESLGADSGKITITRNLKFDMRAPEGLAESGSALRERFCLPSSSIVWVAGSTHAGEEEKVVDVYRRLVSEGCNMALVLVPRHPERCRAVGEMMAGRDLNYVLRSTLIEGGDPLSSGDILLVDTVGELLSFYALSDLVFVGGSLVPVGGHNVLEASLLKKPVVFGVHTENFREISLMLLTARGGLRVKDSHELLGMVRQLAESKDLRRSLGEGGFSLLQQNAGAAQHTLDVISPFLSGTS